MTLDHAFSGSDITSALYGQDKFPISKLLEKFNAAKEEFDVFLQRDRTPETICEAGVRMFVILYSGKDSDLLTHLRYLKYVEMASSSRTIRIESLPPTQPAAALFYAYQLYFQLQE